MNPRDILNALQATGNAEVVNVGDKSPPKETIPTFRGKQLKSVAVNIWLLEGKGCCIVCEGSVTKGWKARFHTEDGSSATCNMYGKDLEKVLDQILLNEHNRIQGAAKLLDERVAMLNSLV